MKQMHDSLGLYLSVPFCKAKCSFCNFASDVFARSRIDAYIDHLCAELHSAHAMAARVDAHLPNHIDTVYLGGGTPSLLEPHHLSRLFATIRQHFDLAPTAEITLEAAPGQIEDATLQAAMRCGINRISLGVQSFVDTETTAIGRLHTGTSCHAEIARLRAAGVPRLCLDLIAGLPHQTAATWAYSLDQAVTSQVDHISIYLLEVDEDSRLGREALAGGSRYHARALPSDDNTAEWYGEACDRLAAAGLLQYEISNFAQPGHASRHNLKYWTRSPYLGAGLDAHSMLHTPGGGAIRWANTAELEAYLTPEISSGPLKLLPQAQSFPEFDHIGTDQALEEEFFLGLRLNRGINLAQLTATFGEDRLQPAYVALNEIESAGLIERSHTTVRLTARGRLASNEVFSRLLIAESSTVGSPA